MNYEKAKKKIKFGLNLAAGVGASMITDRILDRVAPPNMGRLKRAFWKIGTFFVGSMAADAVGTYAEKFYDEVEDTVTSTVTVTNSEGKVIFGKDRKAEEVETEFAEEESAEPEEEETEDERTEA